MLTNYLKIALRGFRKHRAYALINVLGLAAATAASLMILLFAYNVLTFDAFHSHADDVYFLYRTRPTPDGAVPVDDTWYPLLDEAEAAYPAIVDGVRFLEFTQWARYGEAQTREMISFVDPSLFTVFDGYHLLRGDPATALANPASVVLSQDAAQRFFGNADPIGKTVTLNFDRDYTVTGILADVPANSSFDLNVIAPVQSLPFVEQTGWGASYVLTFVELDPGADPKALEAQFPAFVDQFFRPNERGDMKLMPLTDYNDHQTGRRRYAYVLLAVGLGILLIACINFTNLATAQATLRAREIGMRKVLGATRWRLSMQFVGEAMLMSFASLAVGCGLAELLLPVFDEFVGLTLQLNLLADPKRLLVVLAFGIVVGLLAGGYPALYLSRFSPGAALKEGVRAGGRRLRHGLVVVQFALSIILLVGVGVMYRQIVYMKDLDLNFDAGHVVVMRASTGDFADQEAAATRIGSFEDQLAGLGGVVSVSASAAVPGHYGGSYTLFLPEGQQDRSPLDWRTVTVDDHYFDTFGISFAQGRDFSRDFGTDADDAAIINETAMRTIGWTSAIGKKLLAANGGRSWTIVGVVKDFHFQSADAPIAPVVHFFGGDAPGAYQFVSARLKPGPVGPTVDLLRKAWQQVDATRAPDYFFMDQTFDQMYRTEENTARVVTYAALLAILIACLGLFGLSSFVVVQRTKEVGVRKVLGARVRDIVFTFGIQFVRPVLGASLLGLPVAYALMHRWLLDFPYRVSLFGQLWIFAGAGLAALLIALVTVSAQTIRAARANPTEALRYE